MTFRQRVAAALKIKNPYDRDKQLHIVVNKFILKSGINPRLFDGSYRRIRRSKKPHIERRLEE